MAGALIAGGVVAAIGAIRQGQAAKNEANFQAAVAGQQAKSERQSANAAADDARRKASRTRAARFAVGGGSGLEEDTGSSLLAAEDFSVQEELAAQRLEHGGEIRGQRLEQKGSLLRTQGKNAQTSSFFSAGSSLLTAGSAFKGGGGKLTGAETAPQFGASRQFS